MKKSLLFLNLLLIPYLAFSAKPGPISSLDTPKEKPVDPTEELKKCISHQIKYDTDFEEEEFTGVVEKSTIEKLTQECEAEVLDLIDSGVVSQKILDIINSSIEEEKQSILVRINQNSDDERKIQSFLNFVKSR